jgi:uncharacterized caspase-like protein
VYDSRSRTDLGFWAIDTVAGGRGFSQMCSLRGTDDQVISILPYRDGFIIFHRTGKAQFFSPSSSLNCDQNAPIRKRSRSPLQCTWTLNLGGATLVSAVAEDNDSGSQFMLFDSNVATRRATVSLESCSSEISEQQNLASFDNLQRLQKKLKVEPTPSDHADAYSAKKIIGSAKEVFILSGALVEVSLGKTPKLLADLVGHPSGALEVEVEDDVLVSAVPLLPLRLFDLRSSIGRSVTYDAGERYEKMFAFSHPYALVRDSRSLMLIDLNGRTRIIPVNPTSTRTEVQDQTLPLRNVVGVCSGSDGARAWVTSSEGDIVAFVRHEPARPLEEVGRLRPTTEIGYLYKVACDATGRATVITDSLTNQVLVLSSNDKAVTLVEQFSVSGSSKLHERPSLSRNGLILAIGGSIFSRTNTNSPFTSIARLPNGERVVFDPYSPQILILGEHSSLRRLILTNSKMAALGKEIAGFGSAVDGAFLSGGRLLLIRGGDEFEIWPSHRGSILGSLAFGSGDEWLFAGGDSRFDTNMIEGTQDAQWLMPDDPLRPLPPEIFMRDYFEPRLLARLSVCRSEETTTPRACGNQFDKVRPLASLNRVQPMVKIINVSRGTSADMALVSVEVSSRLDLSQPNGKTYTDPYDLRLFRDGQLVARWPEVSDGSDEISAWRKQTRIFKSSELQSTVHVFPVQLPTVRRNDQVIFTAYAFNEDRVKSATARNESYRVPEYQSVGKPKAYIVTIGINSYEAASRNLRFAVRDAQAMQEALGRLEGYDVVPISLTSDVVAASWHATKANMHEIFSRLSGAPPTVGTLVGVDNVGRLARATPDDLVIVTFSGHGHTAQDGTFYLLPSDSGTDLAVGRADLAKFVSSEELSEWLRPIDAGQMAMIIDACHSAASVDQPGFKPGPMGDRGLGQLAYDKAMRILAASQADDVALESEKLKQGLLTYALVHDGLALGPDGKRVADANHDGQLTLGEWLRYGEQHTPVLFEDIKSGRKEAVYVGRDSFVDPSFKQKVVDHAQTPTLFDFARAPKAEAVIH